MDALPPRPGLLAFVWLFVALWLVATSARVVLAQDPQQPTEGAVTESKTGHGRLLNSNCGFFEPLHDEWGMHVNAYISQLAKRWLTNGALLVFPFSGPNQLRQICWRHPWLYRRQPTPPPFWGGGWP